MELRILTLAKTGGADPRTLLDRFAGVGLLAGELGAQAEVAPVIKVVSVIGHPCRERRDFQRYLAVFDSLGWRFAGAHDEGSL